MKELKALYIIVNAGFSAEVVEIARSLGSTGATIINARGSVAKPKTILGITIDTEKEIVLSVVEKSVAIKIMEKVKEHRFDVDVAYRALTEERIRELHEAGIKINCWTVNTVEEGERLAAWGVDYITTNILE